MNGKEGDDRCKSIRGVSLTLINSSMGKSDHSAASAIVDQAETFVTKRTDRVALRREKERERRERFAKRYQGTHKRKEYDYDYNNYDYVLQCYSTKYIQTNNYSRVNTQAHVSMTSQKH